MNHLDYIGDFFVDPLMVGHLCGKDYSAHCGPLIPNEVIVRQIKQLLGKFPKSIINKVKAAVQNAARFLKYNENVGCIIEWGPYILPFVVAGLLKMGVALPAWLAALGEGGIPIALAALLGKMIKNLRELSFIEMIWKWLKAVIGRFQWSLLWNPWFIGGSVVLGGLTWFTIRWWSNRTVTTDGTQ